MKVAQNFILYNFDYMTKVQFLIDFELQNQSQILTQNPNFWELFLKQNLAIIQIQTLLQKLC